MTGESRTLAITCGHEVTIDHTSGLRRQRPGGGNVADKRVVRGARDGIDRDAAARGDILRRNNTAAAVSRRLHEHLRGSDAGGFAHGKVAERTQARGGGAGAIRRARGGRGPACIIFLHDEVGRSRTAINIAGDIVQRRIVSRGDQPTASGERPITVDVLAKIYARCGDVRLLASGAAGGQTARRADVQVGQTHRRVG